MNELVSVIVPIYNVEDYLARCVDSIIGQSYKNLEIILVDDGSTDNSRLLVDQYKEKDSRIISVHKNNGGLSSARNEGLKIANGYYVCFIDSDDFISDHFIENLYTVIIVNNCDIAFCNYFSFSNENEIRYSNHISNHVYNNRKEIMNNFFNKNCGYSVVAWNKLYKKSLFNDINYPEELIYEDEATTYKLFYKSNKIVFHDEVLYFYFQRAESITNSNLKAKNISVIDRLSEIVQFYNQNLDYEFERKAKIRLLKNCSIYVFRAKKESGISFFKSPSSGVAKDFYDKYLYYLNEYKYSKQKIIFDIYGLLKNIW